MRLSIVGGDHSITLLVLRAFDDTRDGTSGNVDHASWVNRAAQLSTVQKIIQLGQQGLANDEEAMANARKANTMVIIAKQIHRKGVEWVLAQI